jgi:hypothetical protein
MPAKQRRGAAKWTVHAFTTEGGPLFVGTAPSADRWSPQEPLGGDVVVEYMGAGFDQLPAAFRLTKKPGRQAKKFTHLEEAKQFAASVEKAYLAIFPEAARPPKWPNHPGYYADGGKGERLFSIEIVAPTHYDKMVERLRGTAKRITFDAPARAEALFIEQEAGPALVAVRTEADTLLYVKPHYATETAPELLADRAASVKLRPIKEHIDLTGKVVALAAANVPRKVAERTFSRATFGEALSDAPPSGPLLLPNQAAPGGAFVTLREGRYRVAVHGDASVGKEGATVVRLEM